MTISRTPRAPLGVRGASLVSAGIFLLAALGVIQFARPASAARRPPFALLHFASAAPARDAFGTSGAVKLRFALPGDSIEFPLEVAGDPSLLTYQWIRVDDGSPVDSVRSLAGAEVRVPDAAGFYRLAVVRDGERHVLAEPTLGVMVPFTQKVGALLNGYRIGTYVAERLGNTAHSRPEGFLEVRPEQLDLPVSQHFRLSDFVTHDAQGDVWPKYVALNPRLLDKLELVVAKLREQHPGGAPNLALDVHSGFRTPAYNARVLRSAPDSRHQYGDAADVAFDVDGDGRVTLFDEILVARAVDDVEAEHPELVGGLGLYVSRRYRTPYVHIDARGRRTRWRG